MKQQTIYNQLKQLATATMCERWHGVKGGKCFTCCAYKEARDRETFDVEKYSIVKFWVGFKASLEYSKLSHHDKLSALAMFLADKPTRQPTNQQYQPASQPASQPTT
jgi:hypothetical protein